MLAWALCLAAGLAPRPAAALERDARGQEAGSGAAEEVARLLGEAREGGASAEALARQLAALGSEAVPALFKVLDEGRFSAGQEAERGWRITLDPKLEEAVLAAFERLPWAAVRAHVAELAASEAPERTKLTALCVLAAAGEGRDLDLCLLLANPPDDTTTVGLPLRRAFEEAASAILGRDERAIWRLQDLALEARPGLQYAIVRSIAGAASPDALVALARLLSRASGLEALILAELSRLGASAPRPVDEYVLSSVRDYLGSGDPELLHQAVLAVGRLEDLAAVPRLLDVLEADEPRLRQSALRSLQAVTHLPFRGDPERWRAWYNNEVDWWDREASIQLALLRDGEEAEVARTLLAVARKRLHRHELARSVLGSMPRANPDLSRIACATLGALRSPLAIPELVSRLEDPDEGVSGAAWNALRRITGRTLGPDPALWRGIDS